MIVLGLLAWGPVHSLILGGSVKVGINLFLDGVPVFVFDLIRVGAGLPCLVFLLSSFCIPKHR